MDGPQSQYREKSRPPLRLPARSASSMSNHRPSPQYPPSPASHFSASPKLSNAHPAHRYHHASCAKSAGSLQSSSGTGPELSRQGSMESTRQPAVSPFLQEKLQQERKVESTKFGRSATASRANTDMGASLDFGRVRRDSPFGSKDSDEHRPQSSGTDQSKRSGMGLREMEKNISDLHKQNFNLKLEVSKRRERQVELETRLTSIQAEKDHADDMNEKLVKEVEKRDKAIQEAVSMIVMLEAKVNELSQETSLLRRDITNGSLSSLGYATNFSEPPPRNPYLDIAEVEDEDKTMTRVPSFISEKSDMTETLRSVYLNARGSAISLSPLTVKPYEVDAPGFDLASPTFSTLSRSSFPSVYGQLGEDDIPPFATDEPSSFDGVDRVLNGLRASRASTVTPDHPNNHMMAMQRPPSAAPRRIQPITDVIARSSPLQQLERLDSSYAKSETPRPQSRDATKLGPPTTSAAHKYAREQKREARRREMIDTSGGVRLHDQALPPTPDTMSTSTLRRYKNSDDTLALHQDSLSLRSKPSSGQTADYDGSTLDTDSGAPLDPTLYAPQSELKLREFKGSSYFDTQLDTSRRVHSAGSSAFPHSRGNDWSGGSENGDADARSLQSSDIWMRQGATPDREDGRISPDLFGFPTSGPKGDWAPDVLFGLNSLHPMGATLDPSNSQISDLFAGSSAMFTAGPPPPPHRRSSLKAATGSRPPSAQDRAQGTPSASPGNAARRTRRSSEVGQARSGAQTPVQQNVRSPSQPGSARKRSQYPPITGHQNPRTGLNRIWRRSFGSGSSKVEAAPDNAPEEVVSEVRDVNGASAIPPWMYSDAMDEDRSGATPPPIKRFPAHTRTDSSATEKARPFTPEQGRMSPTPQVSAAPVDDQGDGTAGAASGPGSRRKWLPSFGRSSSLRSRNA